MNLVNSTQALRLLDAPWSSKNETLSQTALKKAKTLCDQWEGKYFHNRVRHSSPNEMPKIVTFDKVDDDIVVPLLTLGGKFVNIIIDI